MYFVPMLSSVMVRFIKMTLVNSLNVYILRFGTHCIV